MNKAIFLLLVIALALSLAGCGDVIVVGDHTSVAHYTSHETAAPPEPAPSGGDEAFVAFLYGAFVIMALLLMGFMLGFGRLK